jgi:hypothetical protein
MFTRKHYVVIASVFARHSKLDADDITNNVKHAAEKRQRMVTLARDFAIEFKLDNPKFSIEKFYAACGIGENV